MIEVETASNFTLARRMYSPETIELINSYKDRTERDIVREDWWSTSYSTSDRYSRDLGILLNKSRYIFKDNSRGPVDPVEFMMRTTQFYAKLINANPIKELIQRRQKQGQFRMLDLMSYGAVHKELGVQGCVVALSDKRREGEEAPVETTGIHLVEGDILCSSTWNKVNKYLETNANLKKFGVILCHPMAGLDYIPSNINVYRYIFNHVYQVLSPDEGTFLTNFHSTVYNQVKGICNKLNAIDGIKAVCYPADDFSFYGKFRLTRLSHSPNKLSV